MFKLTGKCLVRSCLLPPSTTRAFSMTSIKRSRSLSDDSGPTKRQRPTTPSFRPIKIASAEAAGRVDADPPMNQLEKLLEAGLKKARKGKCVIYWMRMADLRGNISCPPLLLSVDPCCSKRQSCAQSGVGGSGEIKGSPHCALHH